MIRTLFVMASLCPLFLGSALGQTPPTPMPRRPAPPRAPRVVLEDQFGRPQDAATYRGRVLVLVFGDRQSADANKRLGEWLHVRFHPAARGLPPIQARQAPVRPLAGQAPGRPSPDVLAVPVACVGKVPGLVQTVIKNQICRASPDVPVWLDFQGTMEKQFGLVAGVPNVAVLDTAGRLRYAGSGNLTNEQLEQMVTAIEGLRKEALTPPIRRTSGPARRK